MNVKILKKEEDKLSFVLSKTNPAFANALRRIMLEEVPTLAIEDVSFVENSSALYDEMIAHRLGLIPLTTDLKTYNLPNDCSCKGKGCAKCQVKFKLEISEPGIVYASSLKFGDKAIKPVYLKMPIVKLGKKQELKIEGTAVLGQGKEHSKWSPALVYYRYYPEIEIKKCDNVEEVVKICPKKVFESKSGNLKVKDLEACDLCMACVDICKGIEVKGRDDEFIFYLESWGQLKPKEIVTKAIEIFDKKLDDFSKLLG